MKILFLLPIFIAIILSACQQKATKEDITKPPRKETVKHTETIQPVPVEKNKTIKKTINGVGIDGDSLKILIYRYIDSTNNQYIRDFDIVNNKDSIVFSGLMEELYQEEQRSEEELITVHMTPSYFINNTSPLTMTMGLYIKDFKNGSGYCLSRIIDHRETYEHEPIDSLLQILEVSFGSKGIYSLSIKIVPQKSKISVDSLYSLYENSNNNEAFWIKQELCISSLSLFLNDSISFKEASKIQPDDLNVGTCETYIPQYLFKVLEKYYSFLTKENK